MIEQLESDRRRERESESETAHTVGSTKSDHLCTRFLYITHSETQNIS